MSLYQTLDQDFKVALKARDEVRVAVLRMLRTAIKHKEVQVRRELEEGELLGLIKSQVKQHRDSIDQFSKGGREDLVEREKAELVVLEGYLPTQLSREEIDRLAAELIDELEAKTPKDMGRVMKTLMGRYAGQVDGKTAGEIVKQRLSAV